MEADLFSARDAAALLAIRQSLDEGCLSGAALRAAFTAAGLVLEPDEPGSRPGHAGVDSRANEPPQRAA